MRTRGAGRDVDAIIKRRNVGEELTLRRNIKFKTFVIHTLFLIVIRMTCNSRD